ncbi:UDP-N-acetylmuramoyl-L-alanyl-D-glutamate--2,6-diaminopimelate ligase [Candidatus Dependentiae bacterium]|nr:UDP-N-acetylmuramoyl-L-alanyl-D-glutamate--2,6-diaminopimelate ligase [Candidatus Dependentiae bacterium]
MLDKIYPVTCHTDHVGKGSTFVVIKGMKEDGAKYIAKAIELGAKKVVIEKDCAHLVRDIKNIEIEFVDNARKALAVLSAQAYGFPAKKLKIIGITGTKGKTTTTFLTEHILKTAGYKTALLSTVKNKILDKEFSTKLTTAQPDYLHMFLSKAVQAGVEYVVMEVAAQALSLYRVYGIEFDAVIFTNFSQEHAEFYSNLDEYFEAKVSILKQLKKNAPFIFNLDDEKVFTLKNSVQNSLSFSLNDISILKNSLSGIEIEVDDCKISCPALVGKFNIYNILAAIKLCKNFDVSNSDLQKACVEFTGVPGRLDKISLRNGSTAFIDYAHNPASFDAVLNALRPYTNHLIVLFGAGGDRDAQKRPMMGDIAAKIADVVILTTDNPRSEDPRIITEQIYNGINASQKTKVFIELDREQAIKLAYKISSSSSTIMCLGKGPDEYQIVQGITYPFSEKNILKSLI